MSVDAVLTALADPTRRHLLDVLGATTGASASALARELPVTRQAVLKHLAVLADCALVTSDRAGREVVFRVRAAPLLQTAKWLENVAAQWDDRLADLKHRAERDDPKRDEPKRDEPK